MRAAPGGRRPLNAGARAGGRPAQRLALEDSADFGGVRFMESYESRHSDHSFTGRLAARLGVTRPPLRIDSQAKYGAARRAARWRFRAGVPGRERVAEGAGGRGTLGGARVCFSFRILRTLGCSSGRPAPTMCISRQAGK